MDPIGACVGPRGQRVNAIVDVYKRQRLYRPVDGRKEYTGVLSGYEDGDVTVDGRRFPKGEVALVRLHVTF